MSLLSVVDVAKFFGARAVFEHVSFTLAAGEKVALVGRNGVGKTTLMKVIAGQMDADDGSIHIARSALFGFLSQDTEYFSERSVYDEMKDIFADTLAVKADVASLEAAMSTPEVHDDPERLAAVMGEYARKSEEFEAAGGYMIDARIRSVLFGLGFKEEALSRRVNEFSGGERVRLRLGRLLLAQPSLLLLDEPTNHLDLHATEWLEEYIRDFPGAILVVSHDRYFLDMVSQKTIELENRQATVYSGNYSAYVLQKEERRMVLEAASERQREEIARLQSFVDKWRAGTKSTMAKSREKAIARMEIVGSPLHEAKAANIRFSAAARSGKEVVKMKGLTKTFGDRTLFRPFTAVVERGDRVGLIGPNGAGKSTLIKLMLGQESPTGGSVEFGSEVTIGYFSQTMVELNLANTVLEEVEAACGLIRERVRTVLGCMLFTGEEVFKPIRILSGGERNRVVLAKLLVSNANLLILDEPTNHLDIRSKDALEQALLEYNGTVLLVSHDRYFLDHLVSKVLELEDGNATLYKGNYSEYRESKAARAAAAAEAEARAEAVAGSQSTRAASGRPPRDNSARERRRSLVRQAELEALIESEEAESASLEEELSYPELFMDGERSRTVLEAHRMCQERLAALYVEWEEVTRANEQE